MSSTVFSRADILLPPFEPNDPAWEAYAVIACDQFTSEPEYWEKARAIAGDGLSTLGLILPEAYLGTEMEKKQKTLVRANMQTISEKLVLHEDCLIYIERTLPDGRVRPGLVGKLDLLEYDFEPDSISDVRATEETVVSRIPPRVAVRRDAEVELPHVMVFANDTEKKIFAPLAEKKNEMELLYSFPLMLGGGRIEGYKLSGKLLSQTEIAIGCYEGYTENEFLYAMGDGNHSLASAKAHFEEIRSVIGDEALDCRARYALVELVDLNDDSIEFEPIYRLLTECDPCDVLSYFASRLGESKTRQKVVAVVQDGEQEIEIPALHALDVGSLQMLIDDYLRENPGVVCDYIHGTDSLRRLSSKEGSVGFLCDGIEKNELFSYVAENGTLPRKTFSMGEAASKRYYIEARYIRK